MARSAAVRRSGASSCRLPHHALYKDGRSNDGFPVRFAQACDLAHLSHRALGRHRHDGAEVARRLAVDQIAPAPPQCAPISAQIKTTGMPALPKPPIMTMAPSCMSASAACGDSRGRSAVRSVLGDLAHHVGGAQYRQPPARLPHPARPRHPRPPAGAAASTARNQNLLTVTHLQTAYFGRVQELFHLYW